MADREDETVAASQGSPTSATALRAIALALLEGGYDPRDAASMHRLAVNLRSLGEMLDRARSKERRRSAWITIAGTAVATGAAGTFFAWLTQWFHGGPSQPPHIGGD